jgi:two-component system, cell cycle response regulator
MSNTEPVRILVVDDDQTLVTLLARALQEEGYSAITATSGQEALRRVAESPLDIVLLDINLPDMSGIAVMRQIIKTRSIIVILITGDTVNYSHNEAIREGAADFITKPVRMAELAPRIRQARQVRLLAEAKEQLMADLKRLAIRDELTGLFNYRHFQAQLDAEVHRCMRYQRTLSMILSDVDHFKTVNDTLGHTEGDRVLAGIARVLCEAVRTTDTVFRYGGEEFAILLPETTGETALTVAGRAREAVEQMKLLSDRRVTISAGVAEFRPKETGKDLVCRADTALYAAKHAGRNCVELA